MLKCTTGLYINAPRVEDKFIEYVQANKGLLLNTTFIPMMTWHTALFSQKEFSHLVDGFVVMPYSIYFLKEIVEKAINNKITNNNSVLITMPGIYDTELIYKTEDQALFMKQLLKVLDANLDREDLNTAFIADQLAISPRQYYRKFKDISHLSSANFIKSYRIEKAANLLRETDLPIQDVIDQVGIQSRSYFYKEFVSRYGVTPKVFRQNLSDDYEDDLDLQNSKKE